MFCSNDVILVGNIGSSAQAGSGTDASGATHVACRLVEARTVEAPTPMLRSHAVTGPRIATFAPRRSQMCLFLYNNIYSE